MGRPKRGRQRVVIYLPPQVRVSIVEESKSRKMPLGDLVEEAFASRVVMIRKKPK